MQVTLDHVGTIFGGSFDLPAGTVAMTRVSTAAGTQIAVTDYSFGTTQILDLNGNGLPQVVQTDWHVTGRTGVSWGATDGSLADAVLQTARQASDQGVMDGQTTYLGPGGRQYQAASLLIVDTGGIQMGFVAATNGSGLACFEMESSGAMTLMQTMDDNSSSYLSNVTDLVHVQVGSSDFLYAASAGDHGITGYSIGVDGHLSTAVHLGREQSLPVQTVTTLETAQVAGQTYLIAGASGSSSLSVMAVDDSGALTVTDHLIDTLDTRFAGVAQLDVVSVGGFTFVLAAGMDDGLSLFTLTPNGQLVHLDSLPDSLTAVLDGVSGLAAQIVAGGIEIVTTAAGEAGLSLFRVDLANLGVVIAQASGLIEGTAGDDILSLNTGVGAGNGTLIGGAGNDILCDGAGSDQMTGGAGADTFLLAADGQRDVITDIQVGVDRLDLSLWSMLYTSNQIVVETTASGAVLRFGDEVLELHSIGNTPLDAQDVAALLPEMLSRAVVVTSSLQEPDPDLTPPVPGVQVVGTDGANRLESGLGDDTVDGRGGSDTAVLNVARNDVTVSQNTEGAITVVSTLGTDVFTNVEFFEFIDATVTAAMLVSGGNVTVSSAPTDGADSLTGGSGDDQIDALDGNDTIYGGHGNDGLKGRGGNDLIYGGDGDDRLPGEGGNDTIYGEDGNDRLGGGFGNDYLDGGAGNDRGGAGPGNDTIRGGSGNDIFNGGADRDDMDLGDGNDRGGGSYGHDVVRGGAGNDTLGGGEGNDTMYGGDGNDRIGAGGWNDTVYGDAGDDFLGGGDGDDHIEGGAGQDTLNGGHGDDTLWGGSGADVFVFNSRSASGVDVIEDFEDGSDLLRLVGRILPANDPLSRVDIGDSSFEGQAAARVIYGDHTIYVLGITAAELTLDDFLFA